MTTRLVKSALLGGFIAFVWSAVSWMALPWHPRSMHAFEHDVDVVRMLDFGASRSGVYIYPAWGTADMRSGTPSVFVAYTKEGMRPLGMALTAALLTQIAGGFLLCWLLSKTSGLPYGQKVLFSAEFGLAVGVLGYMPSWIWWGFGTDYILVSIADCVIAWALAGLAIGKVLL